ncbi:CRISPR-associated helicase Cas3 [Thermoanaerobacter italicus Ab9]|uniref:CRISPR-associated helicase Cas3 n=2 Tax=Thermoanaerobacter TaxID=1754 RepID=D3T699_THEIA|nr:MULTISPECIES: CRISPR-associated helicase/endonuclease Cas3 [Thermoanaerobacter]ADD03493.1 CRISPR-associated helicase Cas3 [Thermoanaerobacter italicus Ab9]MDP9750252.1 CRISPR-associated endonuclease/helicase Cas3 [Thermoanaerobacter pentosaceus]
MSSFSELYSHPDKFLEDHLINTSKIIRSYVYEKNVEIIDKDTFLKTVTIISLCHDFGKATSYFQKYLFTENEIERNKLKTMEETHHSLLSAVVAFYLIKNEINTQDRKGILLPFIAFLIVKNHHGDLKDIFNEVILDEKELKILKKQLNSIDDEKLQILNKNLKNAGLNKDLTKSLINEYIDNINSELRKVKRELRKLKEEQDISIYLLLNFLFSLLIDADKTEVVVGIDNIKRPEIKFEDQFVKAYKASFCGEENDKINLLREEAYKEALEREINIGQRIMSINLPTGLGKTLTTIAFSMKLWDILYKHTGVKYRIIYSLPFLSIIDQNSSVIEELLKYNGIYPSTEIILKHHHLSDVKYTKSNSEFEDEQAKILIEGWNSEIIITTFVQFFHTLVSEKNKTLRKFHRLSNSIIILDEVQSIPFKYWLLIKELLKAIAEELNSYIIFVTATQPLIFKEKEIYPLVDKNKYFAQMERVEIIPKLDCDITLEELSEMFDLSDGRSYLFILNTIKSAQQFYSILKTKVPNDEIIYISTHITPLERMERIEKIKKGKIKFAVTTQLVEAGVDIDFDVVVRDIAPLDSINQSAGRCNRNWNGKGKVYIVSLIDEKGQRYSRYIYDRILLDITREILSKYDIVKEQELLKIIEKYYHEVSERMSSSEAKKLLDAIYALKYDSDDGDMCISKFKLIEDDYYKVDAFIELNEEAKELWQKYVGLKDIKNLFERRNIFNRFKADFYKYVISIPATAENMPPDIWGFKYVNYDSLNEYYDKETGFIAKGVISIW